MLRCSKREDDAAVKGSRGKEPPARSEIVFCIPTGITSFCAQDLSKQFNIFFVHAQLGISISANVKFEDT